MEGISVRDFAPQFQPQIGAANQPLFNVQQTGWDVPTFNPRDSQPFVYSGPIDPSRLLPVQPASGPSSAVDNSATPNGTPPRLFDMTGLDFAGLDYVQGFTPGGYLAPVAGEPADLDQFWQSFDTQPPQQQPFGALAESSGFGYDSRRQ
jgi:hypothetical protein